MSIFWTSICTSVTNGFEASRRAGSRVVRVHLQVQSDGLLQFADMRIGPMGGCWRWKCAAHSCFFHSLPWEVRRWGDKLLTTLRNLPHNPPFATGVQHWWEEKPRLASHRLTSPCFWTSLTLPASLLPAQHLAFKFSPPTPPPIAAIYFPVRVAAFFEGCLFATVEVWSIQGMWKSAPPEISMGSACWYLLASLKFRWRNQRSWLVVLEVGQFLHNSFEKLVLQWEN